MTNCNKIYLFQKLIASLKILELQVEVCDQNMINFIIDNKTMYWACGQPNP
jgi:hypothetical protein